jgi:beta-glucosidase
VWGAATSAYQVEGAAGADGRGPSIWDVFCRRPGAVRGGDTGDVACDHFHRFGEDVALMRELGLDAYRFSVAWPRVLPEGRGRVEQRGLDFYDRLVDELLAAGIEPFVTLYHWDLPQALEDAGGWPSRSTAGAFAEFADVVARRLGDRVTAWITHNEPWVASQLGYAQGIHAPGRRYPEAAVAAAHHLLLSHGWAVDVLRRAAPRAQVGITIDQWPAHPATASDADVEAARRFDLARHRWYLDPVLRGAYPEELLAEAPYATVPLRPGDLATIAAPIDFLGVNAYSRALVAAGPEGPVQIRPPRGQTTALGWEVYPDALYEALLRTLEYAVPAVYVTENGAAFGDVRGHDGAVRGPERIEYLARHVEAVDRAIAAGCPVRGYFVWSLLDNFEWAAGYAARFGLVYVDYATLGRVPKASFAWYRDLISRHAPGSRTTASTPPVGASSSSA